MLYALVNGKKERARPGTHATCPDCAGELVARCGDVNVWHWAHRSLPENCEYESEGEWHLNWKALFPSDACEVRIEKGDRYKIADCVLSSGRVLEFQNSPISPEEIADRERFYGKMAWVFNCRDAFENHRLSIYGEKTLLAKVRFDWKWPRRSIECCECPVYLDVGEYLIRPPRSRYGLGIELEGYATLGSKGLFVDFIKSDIYSRSQLALFP